MPGSSCGIDRHCFLFYHVLTCAFLHCVDAGRLWIDNGVNYSVLVHQNASDTPQRVCFRCDHALRLCLMLALIVSTVSHMFDGGIVCQYATKLISWANLP